MSILYPESTQVQGNTSVVVLQTMAAPGAPDLSSDINGASAVNVSCFLYSGGVGTSTTNKGEAPRRLCTTSTLEQFGNTSYSVADLQYVYDPQGSPTSNGNKAKAALVEGTEVYLVTRRGLSAENEVYAVGQRVDVWHVRLGPQNKTQTGDGEFDEYSITQTVVAIEPPYEDVAIVA